MNLSILLEAVSGDGLCLDLLFRPGFSGRVHSVFGQAVNFLGPDDVMYTLFSGRDNAPYTILVNTPPGFRFDDAGLSGGDEVHSGSGILILGRGLTVAAGNAARWQDALPRFPSGSSLALLSGNLAVLADNIAANGKDGGLKAYYTGGWQESSSLFSRELAVRAAGLLEALQAGDFAKGFVCGRSLLGLGTGQTPSGDDFLAGLITVFQLPGGPFGEGYQELSRNLVREASGLTSAISLAMLRQAAAGRARESVIGLLTALTAGEPSRLKAAASRVLALGSSSGTDIAVGVASGMKHGLWLLEMQEGGKA